MPSRERRDGVEAEEWIAPRPLLLAKLILSMADILDATGFRVVGTHGGGSGQHAAITAEASSPRT